MPANPDASDVAKDREMLDRLGYGVLDVQTDSGVGFEDVRRYSYVVDPELSPRATAIRLQKLLGRPFTEREARAAWDEILEFKLRRVRETGEDLSIEQAAREWDERYGLAFRRRWYLTQPEPGQRKYLPGGRERRPGPVGKVAGAVMPELAPLLESGFSVADVLGAAKAKPRDAVRLVLRRVPKSERARHYVRLIAKLTGWQLSNEEAERVWVEVLKHKVRLSRRYGQDVPVERALVDYFKRMRLSGLDRTALWETGQLLNPERAEVVDNPDTPSTKARALFPA